MRSFQAVIVFLFALVAGVFATESESYDATVYITSTLYRVNTVTMSGSAPSAAANQTSTIPAPTYAVPSVTASHGTTGSYGTNGTTIKPTGSATKPSTPEFTGAASSLRANALVAALAALGYLVL